MAKKKNCNKVQEAVSSAPETKPRNLYAELAARMNGIVGTYGDDFSMDDIYSAFLGAGGADYMLAMPYLQNQRIRGINTRPADYSKDQIEQMILAPGENEQALRAVSASLSWSSKVYDLIQTTLTDMLSYYWYLSLGYSAGKPDKNTQKREYALAYKICEAMDIQAKAHEIAGLCMRYGKVFYTPRVSVDKVHSKVNYAFLQQLPTDFCKIVGYNNGPGKYTVAFNLFYFLKPGNDWRQYGDLFKPYMAPFESVITDKGRYVYSAENGGYGVDIDKFGLNGISTTPGSPKWELTGRVWMYWVTLPAEAVFVAEADDREPISAPSTTGLMVSMTQIPNYEAAQMEIVLNPLTSVLTGTLETDDDKGHTTGTSPIRVEPSVRRMFEQNWYNMLAENNTAGIGVYLAPARDLKLQTLSESVSNTNITSTAISDQILKSGLSSVIPTTNDPKVGVVNLATAVQANSMRTIYWCIERLMNWIFESLNFKSTIVFHMFGTVFNRDKDLENARQGMTLGILPDTLRYDAMMGISPLEDMAVSEFISDSGILNHRLPLVSTYSMKQDTNGDLPPQAKQDLNPGGRPAGIDSGEITSKLNKLEEKLNELREGLL